MEVNIITKVEQTLLQKHFNCNDESQQVISFART
jgi:hypothetical protein